MHRVTSWAIAMTLLSAACSSPAQPSAVDSTGRSQHSDERRTHGVDGACSSMARATTGWRGFKQATAPSGWQAVDGALTRTGGGGDLITIEQFANFELLIQWMIAPAGNSGIMFRVSEAADAPYLTGTGDAGPR